MPHTPLLHIMVVMIIGFGAVLRAQESNANGAGAQAHLARTIVQIAQSVARIPVGDDLVEPPQDAKAFSNAWNRIVLREAFFPGAEATWKMVRPGKDGFEHVSCAWKVGDRLYRARHTNNVTVLEFPGRVPEGAVDEALLAHVNALIAEVCEGMVPLTLVHKGGKDESAIFLPAAYPAPEVAADCTQAIVGFVINGSFVLAMEKTSPESARPRILPVKECIDAERTLSP